MFKVITFQEVPKLCYGNDSMNTKRPLANIRGGTSWKVYVRCQATLNMLWVPYLNFPEVTNPTPVRVELLFIESLKGRCFGTSGKFY
jgi:hypothetical protein